MGHYIDFFFAASSGGATGYAGYEEKWDIASLFQKHAAKKKAVAATATSNPNPIEPVVEENAISLVNVAKKRMQELRSDGWDNFLEKVTSFCIKHGIEVAAMDGDYVPYGKSARKARAQKQANDDHFRREVYIGVIDQISRELHNRFDEIDMELLSCMSAFSPSKSFASFDAQKLCRLAKFYPKEFSNNNLLKLELQLDNYIDDMRHDDSFKGLDNIVDLSVKLVETKRHRV
ncbi:uncharacterized protein [Miscanthus floridulus]|uniref:uncharacterized protein n=1 Tax=Miscanthus floridulus TaxID=154761 RepID=UPI003457DDD8